MVAECDFEPGFESQLNMYQNVVNDILSHPEDKPTIGLLLVKGKNKTVVENHFLVFKILLAWAGWQEQMKKELPDIYRVVCRLLRK